jgi:hypothetical protein
VDFVLHNLCHLTHGRCHAAARDPRWRIGIESVDGETTGPDSFDGSNDLFRGTIMNTTIINGGIQAGAVSLTGDATNMGTTNIHYQPQTVEAIQTELTKAIHEIHTSTADPDLKEQALEHVRAAQADPTPDKLTKAIGFLGKIETVTAKVAGVGTSITTLGTLGASIAKLAGSS